MDKLVVHILIVNNDKYVKIAKVCIDSFIYYHPNAIINVHADEKTFALSRDSFKSKNVNVHLDCSSEETWQLAKLKLAINLSGTNQILMDADLKWNGPIRNIFKPTYFVREFTFNDKAEYLDLFKALGWDNYLSYSMKNTSFLSLAAVEISSEVAAKITKKINEFEVAVERSGLQDRHKSDLIRIAEQVALSLLFDDKDCEFLKSSDRQFDGSLVESSYFGATGTRFGILGATSK